MIKFLATCYLGLWILTLALAYWKDLWWPLALTLFVVWGSDIHKDMIKRQRVARKTFDKTFDKHGEKKA